MTVEHTQLSIDGTSDVDTYRRDEVMALDLSHTTNGQRVVDLARLGYLPEPVLDPTYGKGAMWADYMPEDLWAFDLNPEKSPMTGESMDFRSMPFEDNSFASCLYDPAYGFRGTPTYTDEGGFDERYGTDTYRTKVEIQELVLDGARECGRVTRDVLIIKCQDSVVTSSVNWQTAIVKDFVEARGWYLKDSLLLMSYRAQPAGRTQQNARRNLSTFLVFFPTE